MLIRDVSALLTAHSSISCASFPCAYWCNVLRIFWRSSSERVFHSCWALSRKTESSSQNTCNRSCRKLSEKERFFPWLAANMWEYFPVGTKCPPLMAITPSESNTPIRFSSSSSGLEVFWETTAFNQAHTCVTR